MYRGVFPVEYDLRNVVCRMQEVVISPLIPVNRHCTVFVHTVDRKLELIQTVNVTESSHKQLILNLGVTLSYAFYCDVAECLSTHQQSVL